MSAAERQPTVLPVERLGGSGRQPAHIEAIRDAAMDLRAARLDHLTSLNGQRQWAYRIGQFVYTGQVDAALALCGEMQREAVEGIEKLGRRR